MFFPGTLMVATAERSPIVTPYASHGSLSIAGVEAPAHIAQYGIEELRVAADGTYDNPFDPSDVSLDATVDAPGGKSYSVPGFLYRPFTRKLNGTREEVEASGAAEWRVRICPTAPGAYNVSLRFKDRTGATMKSFSFTADSSADPGFVRVSGADTHYFAFDKGKGYFPIGANVCWGNDRGTFNYDDWLPAYGRNGCNYLRLWLSPQWVTFGLEKAGKPSDGAGMGQFDLGDAWKLDYVLDLAAKNGMYAMLCIDSYNILRNSDGYPEWAKTPQNKDNGGPLRIWSDFWTDPQMDRLYKNKLRYLVARYSAFTHVMAWEFWNEVDITQDFNRDTVRDWHQRMGDALHAIDPYRHLTTTSFGDSMGDRATAGLPEIDYNQTHLYSPSFVGGIIYQDNRKSDWGKPHYVGEVGADAGGPRATEDPNGLQVHDPMWISLVTGGAGGAMSWWWDSLIAPHNLYGLYGAFSRFTAGIDFPKEGFRPAETTLAFVDPKTNPGRGDLLITGGPVSWSPGPSDAPQTIQLHEAKYQGEMPSGVLHGVRNHRDLHNPLTIEARESEPFKLQVNVQEVSTYGGATLSVSIDGAVVLTQQFPAGEENKSPELGHKFDGPYLVSVPAGKHTIVVEDTGNDWMRVDYRFVGVSQRVGPPMNAWAITGNDVALAWLQPQGRSWQSVIAQKAQIPPVGPTYLSIPGLAAGAWRYELWDTWSGRVSSSGNLTVKVDGTAKLQLPTVGTDLAVKLIKGGS